VTETAAPDLIVAGDAVHTFDDRATVVEALAIGDGVVVDSGPLERVERSAGPRTERLIVDGDLLPGFCDTHMHFEKIAHELRMVQLGDAETIDEVLQLVADVVAELEPGAWVQSFGDDNAWHETQLRERRLPTRQELDAAAPDHPVFLYRGQDAAALNSAAAERLRTKLDDDAGWCTEDGRLASPRARLLQAELPAPADAAATLEHASRQLLGYGITTVVDPGLPAQFDATWQLYREAARGSQVLQRLYLMDRLDYHRSFEMELERVERSETPRNVERDGVTGFGLKLLVDGEFDDAWMGPGDPQPAPPTKRYTPAQIEATLRLCAKRGWPICFHVIGRGAVDAVLAAVARVGGKQAFERNQVTLAHAFFMSEQNLDDAVRLGVAVSVQPLLAYVFENEMQRAWGEHAHHANPYRQMLDRGLDLAGGSDVLPCEPLRGAAVAVTRTSRLGSRLGADQAVSAAEAISLFTRNAADYVRQPHLGTLEVGAPADFVCWPRNPLDTPADEWPQLRPTLTAIGGHVVWRNDATPSPTPNGAAA